VGLRRTLCLLFETCEWFVELALCVQLHVSSRDTMAPKNYWKFEYERLFFSPFPDIAVNNSHIPHVVSYHLCGLANRVPGYIFRGPGFDF
jgi:hypothetical protein